MNEMTAFLYSPFLRVGVCHEEGTPTATTPDDGYDRVPFSFCIVYFVCSVPFYKIHRLLSMRFNITPFSPWKDRMSLIVLFPFDATGGFSIHM